MINIIELHKLCSDETIRMTNHITDRCRERKIKLDDIIAAIINGEIIEQYIDDLPFPSCLVLGQAVNNNPLHVVCAIGDNELWIITSYFPNLDKWENDYKTRKGVNSQ